MFFSYDSKHAKLLKAIANDPDTPFTLREVFEDPALGQAVADAVGLDGLKTKTNLIRLGLLEKLDAPGRGIESLEGLEFLNGLREADLSGNKIRRLPDYTRNVPNLYKNKDTLAYMDLAGNPFLAPESLFSLDSTEGRKHFLNAFKAPEARFGLGEAREKIAGTVSPDPELVRIAFERFLPGSVTAGLSPDEKEALTDALLLKFAAGKNLYHDKPVWKDQVILNDGKPAVRASDRLAALDTQKGIETAAAHIEQMLLPEDLYLIRVLSRQASAGTPREVYGAGSDIPGISAWYAQHPEALSDGYVHTDRGWEQKDDYASLRQSQMSSAEEKRLSRLGDEGIRNEYAAYLRTRRVLETYLKDHPERERAVSKLLTKSEEFVDGYLDQYLKLQDNAMLSDVQKQTLAEAGEQFGKFVSGYEKDARAFFDQDIFDLEVEMKYIDMLAEAGRDIGGK